MMEDLHLGHGGMTLDTPLYEDPGVHAFNSFAPLQQLPNHAGPSMSWSTTEPTLFINEQNWLHRAKAPLSWQTDANFLHQGVQTNLEGFSAFGQLDMMAALSGDPYNASMNELSQLLQVYSIYQDHYVDSNPSFNPDTIAPPQPNYFTTSASECLQVVNCSSGSDSLSTTETWRSETNGGFAANYAQVLGNLNDPSSMSMEIDTHECNFQPPKQQPNIMQQDVLVPSLQDPWIQTRLQAETERRILVTAPALTHNVTSYDVLPSMSSVALPPLKRPRTWQEALQQGSADNDHIQFILAAKTNRKLEFSSGSQLRPVPSRDVKASSRQGNLPGTFSANHLACPGTSAFSRQLTFQEDGRLSTGKVTVTSVEPQSVAARHRRKKISERIRVLEKLIPGGNKMDTATMLDEAIEYVKFLQLQVRILESDSLCDIPVTATSSTQSYPNKGYGNMDKDGLKRKIRVGSGGDLSAALASRAASSPLILSEVLQQQLFKQKLCLVSIRQCPPGSASTSTIATSGLKRSRV